MINVKKKTFWNVGTFEILYIKTFKLILILKNTSIRIFVVLYFPIIGLNRSKFRKIQNKKTPYLDILYTVFIQDALTQCSFC